MNEHSVTRVYDWEAAHRLAGHHGKCRGLHGHHYVVEVTVVCAQLGADGMVVDFEELDSSIGEWIKTTLDHTTLLDGDDRHPAAEAIRLLNAECGRPVVDIDGPPTAENLADAILRRLKDFCSSSARDLVADSATVFETPRGRAIARGNT